MLKGVSVVPHTVPEYCANNPPPAELRRNFVDLIPLDDCPTIVELGENLAGASLSIPRAPRSVRKRGQADYSSSGLSATKKSRPSSTHPGTQVIDGAVVAMFESEEDEDDDAALVTRRKWSSTLSSSRAPVPTTPLLLQGGGDIFVAIVPPLRSYVGLGSFIKKKIAKPSPSLNPQSTSCQSSGVPLRSESRDSECAVGEVAVRGTGFSGDPVVADLMALEVTVVVAVEPSEEVYRKE
ncbi:uncharacterized protein [Miscanthus floridulus]|uniref:uncharacterized protein isoform X3 n=1 Tax=Miscanthus floridulus TaxID=154761 RepID=UPI0034581217